jgi:hypothetical protein
MSPPPWLAPVDVAGAVRVAGLPLLASEGTVEHIHAHLDVLVDERPVVVPAGVGIDQRAGLISPLQTHDTTGWSTSSRRCRPLQCGPVFYRVAGGAVSGSHRGSDHGPRRHLRAYVNGAPVTGNPGAILLHAHDEIALVYGSTSDQPRIPVSYNFPPGE